MKLILALLLSFPTLTYAKSITIKETVVTFEPQHGEIVEASLEFSCLRYATILEKLNNGLDDDIACKAFSVGGKKQDSKYDASMSVQLKQIGPNQFSSDKLKAAFSRYRKGQLCVNLKVQTKNAKLEADHFFSQVVYCEGKDLPFHIQYSLKRVKTLKEFNDFLSTPITVATKPE